VSEAKEAPGHAGCGVDQHEGGRSLGVGRREQRADRRALAEADEGCLLRAGGVHDCTNVVHALLERGADNAVRHAGSTLVEQEQAADQPQSVEEPRLRGFSQASST
jgi:hypothetical protein